MTTLGTDNVPLLALISLYLFEAHHSMKILLTSILALTILRGPAALYADDCSDLKRVLKAAPDGFSDIRGSETTDEAQRYVDRSNHQRTYTSRITLFSAPSCTVTVTASSSEGTYFECEWDYSEDSDSSLQSQGQSFADSVGSCLAMAPKKREFTHGPSWYFPWSRESKDLSVSVTASSMTTRRGRALRTLSLRVEITD